MQYFLLALALLQFGCTTMDWRAYKFDTPKPTENIAISWFERSPFAYRIQNRMKEDLAFSYEKSSFIVNGKSYRLISGSSLVKNRDRSSPDEPLAANAIIDVYLTPADLVWFTEEGEVKISKPGEGDSFQFNLVFKKENGETIQKTLKGSVHEFTASVSDQNKYLCWGTAIIYGGWCWFLPTEGDKAAAISYGKKVYGELTSFEFVDD